MSHSCDEQYSVYDEQIRKARKEHRCDACKLPIRPGDYYCSLRTVFDGSAETIKRCGACQKTHEHLRELCSSKDNWPDQLWPDERLGCGLDYAEEWDGQPPDEIARLPFLTDEERGKLLEKLQ